MGLVVFLCYLISFVCFLAATANVPVQRVNLIAAGLAAMVLPLLLASLRGM